MGIKDFLSHIKSEASTDIKRIYDHIYMDCNYLIHYLIYNCKNDYDLQTKIDNFIKNLFDTISVTTTVNLIFDGNSNTLSINPKKQTQIARTKYKKESIDYDKQPVSPKSKIVLTFKTYLSNIINRYKSLQKYSFTIHTNDDYIDDEADFKILYDINDNPYDNICIISRDSDMILIACSLIYNKDIKIDILSNLRPQLFINVKKITEKYKYDYILISLLLGNDYLPKLSNVSYDLVFDSYHKYISHKNPSIITDGKLNYTNFINFIMYVILIKKIKLNVSKIDWKRFNRYYNNILWCLKKYKVIECDNEYIEDTVNSVVNIYGFIYCGI
ncbi:MAG: XRN 5'-3' exonuclease [Gaeavirus sp.]|uniref:XRN 5'-3' exonuclease n=1 Tax=Gaeavirus sp. TaxID=2487767 RepID=A0A3G5A198_9VIRU|nr:MAG: XRN 5'-3' exonuclease [Gaeavirus sp.]